MPKTLPLILMAAIVILSLASRSTAVTLYWDGDTDFSWSTPSNWSTTKPVNADPVSAPGASDIVWWGRDLGIPRSIFVGSAKSAAAFVTDTPSGQYPYMDGGPVSLGGATIDLTTLGSGFGSTNNVTLAGTTGTTFGASSPITFSGGGVKSVYMSNTPGYEFKLEGNLLEAGGSSALQKLGFGRFIVEGAYGLTGSIILSQGELQLERGFDVSSFGSILNIVDNSTGNFKKFYINNGQDYKFAGAVVRGTVLAPGSYTLAQLNTLGLGDSFNGPGGNGTLTVVRTIPEPATLVIALLVIASPGFACRYH